MASESYIWSRDHVKHSACSYYRITVPMAELVKQGYSQLYLETHENNLKESAAARLHSDFNHYYSYGGNGILHEIEVTKRMRPAIRNGEPLFPPTTIYDTDDNSDFVSPFNATFTTMGIRGYPDAKLLEPGEGIQIHNNGRLVGEWIDRETQRNGVVFDIERNLYDMKIRHQILRACHGVTVASPKLKSYMEQVVGVKSCYFFPNTVVLDDYEKIRATRDDPNSIRILWQGGASHYVDWYPLRGAVKEISEKYPNVKWVIYGQWFDWVHEAIPDHMVEHHPWSPYETYKMKRGLLNVDINLCPLANNAFNICKSAIKWYEASIWEKPEATLAANVSPYKDEMQDGVTGLLYNTPEEFVQKLSLLIEDADLRQRLGENSKKWVLKNRTPEATIPGLMEYYYEVRAKHKRDLGTPIIKTATLEELKKVSQPLR